MKVLVTGAKGQVGSELVKRGDRFSFTIDAASRDNLDISDAHLVHEYLIKTQPDAVINAAAYTLVDKAESDFEQVKAINELGALNLALGCQELGIPLLHISTDYVFDGNSAAAYTEQDKTEPKSVYGKTKLAGEIGAKQCEQHIILRVAWVFGDEGNNFVKTMLKLAKREHLSVVDDQIGSPTWAGDIADTLLALVQRYQAGKSIEWGLYHYTGSQSVSWYQFAIEIFKQAKQLGVIDQIPTVKAISSEEYPTVAIRPKNSVLDGTKIKQQLNIALPDWHIGLLQVIKNWKA